jgi:hypothetical protein
MAEDTKKAGRIRKVVRGFFVALKWLFVAVLSLLLIGGLYFHGPWKVLTLIGVILATLTIVPKPVRKWVWGCFGIIAVILIVWVFLPDNNEGWEPYTFDDELVQMQAKYAVGDEENAAVIYNELLKSYDANDFAPEFMDDDLENLTLSQPWSTKDYPQMAEWLKGHENTIAMLMKAGSIEKCYFTIDTGLALSSQTIDRLDAMKNWCQFLVRAENNDFGDGRINNSIEKNIAMLRMASHQYQHPHLLSILVGISLDAISLVQFDKMVINYDLTEAQLETVEQVVNNNILPRSSYWPIALAHEKMEFKWEAAKYYEINSKGQTRLSRDPTASFRANVSESFKKIMPADWPRYSKLPYWMKKLLKAVTVRTWFYMPSTPERAFEIIDTIHDELLKMPEPHFVWGKGPMEVPVSRIGFNYSRMLEFKWRTGQNYSRVHELYMRVTADRQAARIIIGLRRYKNEHGRWPGSLEDVKPFASAEIFVDPINDGDYVYKLTDENFTLYSKGKNGIDEEGVRRAEKPDGTKTDDILFWPRKR